MPKSPVQRSSSKGLSTSSPVRAVTDDDDEDDDDAFIRNKRTTSNQHWKRIAAQQASEPDTIEISSDEDSEGSNGMRSKKHKKKTSKSAYVPKWTLKERQNKPRGRVLRDGSSDDEPMIIAASTSNGSRKRSRSASPIDLAPPPALSAEESARIRNTVSSVYPPAKRHSPSPVIEINNSDEDEDLDPALAAVRANVLARGPAAVPTSSSSTTKINTKVVWASHISPQHRQWTFILGNNETFSRPVTQIAADMGITVDDLVLSHNGKHIYRSSTPGGLNIWADVELQGCTQATWQYQQTHADDDTPETPEVPEQSNWVPEPTPDLEAEDNSFRIVLRAAGTDDIRLRVRHTTTVAKVLEAYLRKLPSGSSMTPAKRKAVGLVFEGDRLDGATTLEDFELEDGDIMDIVGL